MAQLLLRTPLHDRHVALGARMVPFAGWEMPVQYEGVIPEHRVVRADCGVFDVSHMGEFEVEGPRAAALLQATLSNDLDKIGPGQAQYTLLTNERGGIVDGKLVQDRVGVRASQALLQMQAGIGSIEVAFADEVRRIDHQRPALPMTARVPHVAANLGIHMRSTVQRNEPDLMHHLEENRHVSGSLNNLQKIVVGCRNHRQIA